MNDILEMYILFSGKVQRVGFRWTVLDHAERLQLAGTVKNLPNGKVELVIQGPRTSLEAFLEAIRTNAGAAEISSIESTFRQPLELFSQFRIIH